MGTAKLRVAIVGCGNVAARHARCIRESESLELRGVCDVKPEAAERLASEHGVAAWLGLDALLGQPDVDAVSVCVPTRAHAEVALRLIEAGKHVLVEKPIDTNLLAARRLVQTARERRRTLSVVSQHRFHDDVQWLHRVLASGRLGRLIVIEGRSYWSRDQAYYEAGAGRGLLHAEDGGILLNQGVHVADLLLWLAGPALSVQAVARTRTHQIAVADTAAVAFGLACGAVATLSGSTSVNTPLGESIDVRCERGSVSIEGGRATRWQLDQAAGVEPPPSSRRAEQPDALQPFRRQYQDFAQAITTGRDPLVTAEQALHVVEVLHEAEHAPEPRLVSGC